MLLQAPVTLSLYRNAEAAKRKSVDVTVPESDQDITVRLTLQAEGSSVEWVFVTYICAPDVGRTQMVTVDLPDERDYTCQIYIDGVLDRKEDLAAW